MFLAVKITPVAKYLFRVEQQHADGFWVCVHDCAGIPWCDVLSYLPSTSEPLDGLAPHAIRGQGQPGVERLFSTAHSRCDWCNQNERRYLAVGPGLTEQICDVCAADLA